MMYLVYEKNYLNFDVDCVEETEMKLFSNKKSAINNMLERKESYINEDNTFTFMKEESSKECLVFADELNDDGETREGEFHICLVELEVNN